MYGRRLFHFKCLTVPVTHTAASATIPTVPPTPTSEIEPEFIEIRENINTSTAYIGLLRRKYPLCESKNN